MEKVLFVKNMCCNRCIATVRSILIEIGLQFLEIKIGEIRLENEIPEDRITRLKALLADQGFSLVDRPAEKIVVQIQALLCDYVRAIIDNPGKMSKLSTYIEGKLHRTYYHLSKTFSTETGMTIEKYVLALKMEKAKELILEDTFSMQEHIFQLSCRSQ